MQRCGIKYRYGIDIPLCENIIWVRRLNSGCDGSTAIRERPCKTQPPRSHSDPSMRYEAAYLRVDTIIPPLSNTHSG